jgi:hypothetical protein
MNFHDLGLQLQKIAKKIAMNFHDLGLQLQKMHSKKNVLPYTDRTPTCNDIKETEMI